MTELAVSLQAQLSEFERLRPNYIQIKVAVSPIGLERSSSRIYRIDDPLTLEDLKTLFADIDPINLMPERYGLPRPLGTRLNTLCSITGLSIFGSIDEIPSGVKLVPAKFSSFTPVAKALREGGGADIIE